MEEVPADPRYGGHTDQFCILKFSVLIKHNNRLSWEPVELVQRTIYTRKEACNPEIRKWNREKAEELLTKALGEYLINGVYEGEDEETEELFTADILAFAETPIYVETPGEALND